MVKDLITLGERKSSHGFIRLDLQLISFHATGLNLLGKPEAFTGSKCMPWAGHKLGTNYTAQGNLLAGPKVIDDMAKAFEEAKGPLASRLFKALKAGDEAGGDKRGQQSAAMLIRIERHAPKVVPVDVTQFIVIC